MKSGRCCKCIKEVNEADSKGLNPFEVREVLQATIQNYTSRVSVSIPLKSGRCCKAATNTGYQSAASLNPFEVREVLQDYTIPKWFVSRVSIPLKSGRCCKYKWRPYELAKESQSL